MSNRKSQRPKPSESEARQDETGIGNRKPQRPKPPEPEGGEDKEPRLGPEIQAKIGQQLRKFYDGVVSQGVPDRFAELLKRLDDKPKDGEPH
jgi:hypothetical protein